MQDTRWAYARIILRYIAAALVAAGYMSEAEAESFVTDPEVLMLVGGGLAVLAEGAYAYARGLFGKEE